MIRTCQGVDEGIEFVVVVDDDVETHPRYCQVGLSLTNSIVVLRRFEAIAELSLKIGVLLTGISCFLVVARCGLRHQVSWLSSRLNMR